MTEGTEYTSELRDTEALLEVFEDDADRLLQLSREMAGVAFADVTEQSAFRAAAQKIVEASQGLQETVNGLEIAKLEAFGGEESYWTVYRLFTIDENRGRIWALDEIWQYLEKNYDLNEETPETLEGTLLEWAIDIETDVAQKRGIQGVFLPQGGGFAFAERLVANPPVEQKDEQKEKPKDSPEVVDRKDDIVPPVERLTARQRLSAVVQKIIEAEPDQIMRQADVKKRILEYNSQLDHGHLQKEINAIVAEGDIFKFRRNKVAYLSLTERPDEEESRLPVDKEGKREEEEVIDVEVAEAVLQALCAPRRHYQQKITINDLWRTVNNVTDKSRRPPDSEIESLKQVCKQLQKKGLVTANSEKMGTGGVRTNSGTSSKRRRSSTQFVFKVGLPSQEVKEGLQKIFDQHDLTVREDLRELLT